MKTSIRLRLILALLTFVLVVGIGSSLFEIASITRLELLSTFRTADVIARIVFSQLRVTLQNAGGGDLVEAVKRDARLASILKDAQDMPRAVLYVAISDSLDLAIAHSDSTQIGRVMMVRPTMEPRPGLGVLLQAAAILKDPTAYEVIVPLLVDEHDFATVRVGVSPQLLDSALDEVVVAHAWRLSIQLILAILLGVAISAIFIHRPLRRIEEGLLQIQKGDLAFRFPTGAPDELGSLTTHINTLSEHLAQERNRQENLVHQGDALRQAMDALEDGVITMDGQRCVVMVNRPACRILGTSLSALAGCRLDEVLGRSHPLTGVVDHSFARALQAESVQIEFPTEDGPGVFVTTCQIVGDPEHPDGGIVTLRDHGRVRRIQELIDHAHVLSRLGQMAAGVAHEIRNPLNAMNIHLELLKEEVSGNGSTRANERVETVQREIARMEKVIHGFLKIARLKELALTRVRIKPFIEDLAALVAPEARAVGVDIEIEVSGEVPDIYGDSEILRQALMNLLLNAIQASRPGSLPVKVSVSSEEGNVCLLIKDHGLGMSADIQPRIFDLYFTTKKDGTGVGLALVQQVVAMHGGTINVQSEPDRGTLFTICLPALAPA